MQRRLFRPVFRFFHEHFGFVQRCADEIGSNGGKHAERKHAAPSDHGQQQRRCNGGKQHAHLPAEADIRGGTRALRCGPCFGHQRHANPEFAAEADTGNGAIDQEIPITLRKCAQAGEHGEHDNRPGEDAHAPKTIGQHAEANPADHGADQRRRHQRGRLCRRKMEIARDRPQHETENKKIEPVHRITERRTDQRLPGIAVDAGRNVLDAVSRDTHFDTPLPLNSPDGKSLSQSCINYNINLKNYTI